MTTSNNQVRNTFIDALNSGLISIPRASSKELQDFDLEAYKDFQAVKKGHIYQMTTIKHSAMQQSLMDKHGTGFWGGSPDTSRFEMLAVSAVEKLTLVSHGKALKECQGILKQCKMPQPQVISIIDFVASI